MSYWIEVHCDVRSQVPDPSRPWDDRICYGHANNFPSMLAIAAGVAERAVIRRAKFLGWTRRRITEDGQTFLGWVCPHCQKFPPKEAAGAG